MFIVFKNRPLGKQVVPIGINLIMEKLTREDIRNIWPSRFVMILKQKE